MILLSPLFSAFKAANPRHELHLLAGRNNYIVAQGNPYIDRMHVHTKRPLGTLRLFLMLLTTRFDVWLDPKEHKSSESSMFCRFARAKMKIGFRGDKAFTHPSCEQEKGGEHYTLRSLRNLRYLGIGNASPRPSLPPTPAEDSAFAAFRQRHRLGRYITVNVSASQPVRYWTDDKWADLLCALPEACGPAVFLSSPGDAQRVEALSRRVPKSLVFGTQSVLGTFPVVKNAAAVLTVDTCIVHVAAAFNVPVVALYVNSPEFYVQYLPLSDVYRAVLSPSPGGWVNTIPLIDMREAVHSLLAEAGVPGAEAGERLPPSVLRNMQ
jgi:ADP-heptose:LPS heptosyltransferase